MFSVKGLIDLRTCRIPGVLQRFCISYLVVAGTAALAARVCSRDKNAFDKEYSVNNLETI